ncbi:translesion error-prone DNA polymerase V autoproteolytic subunit [Agriterribacter sp.]|uniref:LexA family protein n=1 Tax=Agriterribacter sp. TaxID=2821509 RepID=UPI002B78CA10|nr:translesion error-prone DNA polymerase V autoproteolytic subunit [Agriterribacter sp.]HRN56716.1 translesion error-prone DNA polymerase V autoproteolytic subunit [Agriterribacter sp.]HRP58605.1 translesion error-prone DNA polymerase V autoproteolytic subunit [Agriterribacter sp.]
MDGEIMYNAAYGGSKRFTQWDVAHANATGFSAAADDYMERGIDLNEQLIRNKPATFMMKVSGEAMVDAGIFSGDIVIVDRSLKAVNGKIVIAVLNGEMLIRRLEKTFNKVRLVPETRKLSPIDIDLSAADFSIWGVVTYCIHAV